MCLYIGCHQTPVNFMKITDCLSLEIDNDTECVVQTVKGLSFTSDVSNDVHIKLQWGQIILIIGPFHV